jgi:hypothetical protein
VSVPTHKALGETFVVALVPLLIVGAVPFGVKYYKIGDFAVRKDS